MGEFLPRSCAGKNIQSSGTAMTRFQTPSLLVLIWLEVFIHCFVNSVYPSQSRQCLGQVVGKRPLCHPSTAHLPPESRITANLTAHCQQDFWPWTFRKMDAVPNHFSFCLDNFAHFSHVLQPQCLLEALHPLHDYRRALPHPGPHTAVPFTRTAFPIHTGKNLIITPG